MFSCQVLTSYLYQLSMLSLHATITDEMLMSNLWTYLLKISGSREQDPQQRPKAAAAAVQGRSGRQQPQELSKNLTVAAQRLLCC